MTDLHMNSMGNVFHYCGHKKTSLKISQNISAGISRTNTMDNFILINDDILSTTSPLSTFFSQLPRLFLLFNSQIMVDIDVSVPR